MQNYMHSSPSFRVVSVHVTATKRECNISGMTKNYSCIKENINHIILKGKQHPYIVWIKGKISMKFENKRIHGFSEASSTVFKTRWIQMSKHRFDCELNILIKFNGNKYNKNYLPIMSLAIMQEYYCRQTSFNPKFIV